MTMIDMLGLANVIACHIISTYFISEIKYSVKATALIRTAAAIVLFISVYFFINIFESFNLAVSVGYAFTFFAGSIVFFATSKGVFFKKAFLIATYSQFFVIAFFFSGFFSRIYCNDSQLARIIIRTLVYVVALYLYAKYIKKRFEQISQNVISGWLSLSLVAFLFFAYQSYVGFFDNYGIYDKPVVVLFFTIMIIVISVNFVIFNTIRYMNEVATKQQIQLQADFLMQQVEQMQGAIDDAKRRRHDIRHHNLLIAEYTKNGQTEALLKYLNVYEEQAQGRQIERLCENITINNILLAYAEKARHKNISVHFDVIVPLDIGVKETDLVSIFANLMENCIFGCMHSKQPSQEIRVYVAIKNNKLVIHMENTCAKEIEFENGLPKSKFSSGVGLSSIINAASHYNGETDFKNENGVFVCRVLLNI